MQRQHAEKLAATQRDLNSGAEAKGPNKATAKLPLLGLKLDETHPPLRIIDLNNQQYADPSKGKLASH
eukprot:10665207-Alexandrium_andersonii.AAC.1